MIPHALKPKITAIDQDRPAAYCWLSKLAMSTGAAGNPDSTHGSTCENRRGRTNTRAGDSLVKFPLAGNQCHKARRNCSALLGELQRRVDMRHDRWRATDRGRLGPGHRPPVQLRPGNTAARRKSRLRVCLVSRASPRAHLSCYLSLYIAVKSHDQFSEPKLCTIESEESRNTRHESETRRSRPSR